MPVRNLTINRGDTFEWLIPLSDVAGAPLDMTGFTGGTAGTWGKIYKNPGDAVAVKSFTISVLNKTGVLAAIAAGLFRPLTAAQIAALPDDTAGKCFLLVRLTDTDTAALPVGGYVYEIKTKDTHAFAFTPYKGPLTIA